MKKRLVWGCVFLCLMTIICSAQEYMGSLSFSLDNTSGNLNGTLAEYGYKNASRYLFGSSEITMRYYNYLSVDSWLSSFAFDFGFWQELKPSGYTAGTWWDPSTNLDTYTRGVRGYSPGKQTWSGSFTIEMFNRRWYSSLYLKGIWDNTVNFLPRSMSRDTGLTPYANVQFWFIPNDNLKYEQQGYYSYLNHFGLRKPEQLSNYWNLFSGYIGLSYEKVFDFPNAAQTLGLWIDARFVAEDSYFVDNPISTRLRYELSFTVPKTNLTVMLHQELWMRYFNRAKAWDSQWIAASGAVDWNLGIKAIYRMNFYK